MKMTSKADVILRAQRTRPKYSTRQNVSSQPAFGKTTLGCAFAFSLIASALGISGLGVGITAILRTHASDPEFPRIGGRYAVTRKNYYPNGTTIRNSEIYQMPLQYRTVSMIDEFFTISSEYTSYELNTIRHTVTQTDTWFCVLNVGPKYIESTKQNVWTFLCTDDDEPASVYGLIHDNNNFQLTYVESGVSPAGKTALSRHEYKRA